METSEKKKAIETIGKSSLLCSRKDFKKLIGYDSFDSNGVSKMDTFRVDSIFSELDAYISEKTQGMLGVEDLYKTYTGTSAYYKAKIFRRKWTEKDVCTLLESVYPSHNEPCTNEKKTARNTKIVVEVLKDLYDSASNRLKKEDTDICMLCMMILGILPAEGYRKVKNEMSECINITISILDKMCDLNKKYIDSSALTKLRNTKNRTHITRLDLYEAIASTMGMLEYSSDITDVFSNLRIYNVEGLWRTENTAWPIYKFTLNRNGSCNLDIITKLGEDTYETSTYCAWFIYDDMYGSPVLEFLTPEASHKIVIGQKISSKDITSFRFVLNDYGFDESPEFAKIECISQWNNSPLQNGKILKLKLSSENNLQEKFDKSWQNGKMFMADELYRTQYYPNTGIYAITQTCIIITDGKSDETLYRVPFELDERLSDLKLNEVCGILYSGKDGPFIGFESIAKYIDISTEDKLKESNITIIDKATVIEIRKILKDLSALSSM